MLLAPVMDGVGLELLETTLESLPMSKEQR